MYSLQRTLSAAVIAAATLMAEPSSAQSPPPLPEIDQQEINYANKIYLAYILSPDAALNRYAEAALKNLQVFLTDKTSLDPEIEIVAVDIEKDEILFFNPLFWPTSPATPALSEPAQKKLQSYIDAGGLLINSTHDLGTSLENVVQSELPSILGSVNLGPLIPLPGGHTLEHSFYISPELPGSLNHERIFIQAPHGDGQEDVTRVIIASRDWERAAAGLTMAPDSQEWEQVLRGMANIYIYALTGNFKKDQENVKTTLDSMQP